ncbi:hypothetical protein CDAR_367611 [Caerostris darwini]|uniref:Uncharacterized protein n=1 Tax=Caerostris darwini TaxID=1538125 RepID=A0AAV4SVD4_9ARAC|nr:hypothetical protein CDAR_367611 [Caerostris darwini]
MALRRSSLPPKSLDLTPCDFFLELCEGQGVCNCTSPGVAAVNYADMGRCLLSKATYAARMHAVMPQKKPTPNTLEQIMDYIPNREKFFPEGLSRVTDPLLFNPNKSSLQQT